MRFVVMGAGGFAKEVTDLIDLLGHSVVACFQEQSSQPAKGHVFDRVPIVHTLDGLEFDSAVLGVGNPGVRERLMRLLPDSRWATLVHPSASISGDSVVGVGTIVMQNVVVSADAVVGRAALLNVGCYVAHDSEVGAYTHLAPGTNLGGGCHVGALCELGMGTVVLPNIHIAEGCRTGAGAIVTRDVSPHTTVVGVPAVELKQ